MRFLFFVWMLGLVHLGGAEVTLADRLREAARLTAEGEFAGGEKIVREVLSQAGTVTPERAAAWNGLGLIQLNRGELIEANGSLRNSVVLWEELGYGNHAQVAVPLTNLGSVQWRLGRYGSAERHLRRALEIRVRELGVDDSGAANLHNSLGELHRIQRRYGKAEDSFRRAVAIWAKVGHNSARLAAGWNNLALVLREQGRADEGVRLLERAVRVWKAGGHSEYWMGLGNLAAMYADLGRDRKAEAAYRESLGGMTESAPPPRVRTHHDGLRQLPPELRQRIGSEELPRKGAKAARGSQTEKRSISHGGRGNGGRRAITAY